MTVTEKLALADLLERLHSLYDANWFTAEHAIKNLTHSLSGDLLCEVGIKSGDCDELNRRLDGIRNKRIYNFVVKRDLPYMQPVKWRVLLQDNRVTCTDEWRNDFTAAQKEAGLKIDPETAEVDQWMGCRVCDDGPYSDMFYWARAPGSNNWVEFCDLPEQTRAALWEVLETRSRERRREQASAASDSDGADRPSVASS